jgi:predicted nucleic acid-binding protein
VILADTSVWINHLRRSDPQLANLLQRDEILVHPFVIGELALGSIPQRRAVLSQLELLPHVTVASHDEVLHSVGAWALFDKGIGYVDAHVLVSAALTPDTRLWTYDQPLKSAASALGLHASPA